MANLSGRDDPTESSEACNTQNFWSPSHLDELIEHIPIENTSECSSHDQNDFCLKCPQVNLQLQKSKLQIIKLKKQCAQKSSEIKRLRAAQTRSKLAKSSLEEIIREIKEKKWISDEGQDVLNVINQNLVS